MEYEEIIWNLKEQRLGYGISQQALAEAVGITREHLSRIENGKKKASEELLGKLFLAIKRLSPEPPLEIMFDYMRIRFTTTDANWVVHKILRLKTEFMYFEDWGRYGYEAKYILGDVVVMLSSDVKKGVLLELKGKGCRQFESYLNAQKRTWYDFLFKAKSAGGKLKRVDLAINDKVGMLNIPELIEKCNRDECISVFRSFKGYQSGELVSKREDNKAEMGSTLYIGSTKSEVYFCVYEKDYEQYVKKGTPLLQADIKNRFEIRLTNERAELAVDDLLQYQDAGKTAFAIINRYVHFADREENKRRSDWKMNADWANFIGIENRKLKLTTAPEPYTVDKTKKWLMHQTSGSLKMCMILDEIENTNFVGNMLAGAKLSEHQEKIIEQQRLGIDNMILPE